MDSCGKTRGVIVLCAKLTVGYLMQTVDLRKETIILADKQENVEPDAVATHISSTSPRYSLYHYPGSEVVFFIYTCPTGSSIRERMVHASSRHNAFTVAEGEGLKITKKV